MDKHSLEKNIWKYNFIKFLKSMLFFIPILVLFFQDKGLSMSEILLIQSIYSIFVVVMEIPTGILADKFGHKNSIILSLFSFTLGIGMYYISSSFILFLIAELCMGLGTSLFSGSSDSFLFGSLKKLGREKEFKKINGRSFNYALVGYFISSFLGGFIADYYSLDIVVLITLLFFIVAFLFSLSLVDPNAKDRKSKLSFIETFQESSKFVFKDKHIFWMFLFFCIFMMFNLTIEWFYQPYLQFINLDLKYFGLVFSIMALSAMPISHYSHLIEERLGFKKSILLVTILLLTLFIGLYSINSYWSILFIVMVPSMKIFLTLITTDFLLKKVSHEISATVVSFFSMGKQFFFALFAPFLGYLFDIYGLRELILIDSILFVSIFIIFGIMHKILKIDLIN